MPRTKSERQAKKTTSKKTKKSIARKSTKKKADEVPKKRRRSTKEPKRKTKRAKKTEAEESELQIFEVTSELAKSGKKKEKVKVSKQVIALKEKLTTLKMEMKAVLDKGKRKQEECVNLEMEILRLKRLLEQKVEEETKKDERYKTALNEKEVELKRCLRDIKQLQQNLVACKEEHKKTKTHFEDALKKERAKDSESSSDLARKLKKTEDAYREGKRKLNNAESRYADTQRLLEQSLDRFRISEKKVKSLGAELQEKSKAKSFVESDLSKLYENVSTFLKKLESESKRVRKIRAEKDLSDSGSSEQSTSISSVGRQVGKPLGDSRVNNMISRLSAALKVVNEERSFIISKLTTPQTDINDEPESKIDLKANKSSILEKQHKQLILEKKGLEEKVNKMSAQLEMLEGRKKIMGMTIREGTKGRMKLRKMLEDIKRAKVNAEAALLTKESEYSKQVQELRAQLATLRAKSSATPVAHN